MRGRLFFSSRIEETVKILDQCQIELSCPEEISWAKRSCHVWYSSTGWATPCLFYVYFSVFESSIFCYVMNCECHSCFIQSLQFFKCLHNKYYTDMPGRENINVKHYCEPLQFSKYKYTPEWHVRFFKMTKNMLTVNVKVRWLTPKICRTTSSAIESWTPWMVFDSNRIQALLLSSWVILLKNKVGSSPGSH